MKPGKRTQKPLSLGITIPGSRKWPVGAAPAVCGFSERVGSSPASGEPRAWVLKEGDEARFGRTVKLN